MLMSLKKSHLLFTKEGVTTFVLIVSMERLSNTDKNLWLGFQNCICIKQNVKNKSFFISSTVKNLAIKKPYN